MYTPKHYQTDEATLRDIIIANNFGTLITVTSSLEDVKCVRAPFLVSKEKLYCHVATENELWKSINSHPLSSSSGAPVVCTFDGPHHYISPRWYKSEQDQPGNRVPTWHHASAVVKGNAKIINEAELKLGFLKGLTHFHETQYAEPGLEWNMQFMSNEKLFRLLAQIQVIEIEITHIEGTLKMGQKGIRADREGAAQALTLIGTDLALHTAFLTRACELPAPMENFSQEVKKIAKEREERAKERGRGKELKWWDICVGVVLVGVPLLAYRVLVSKR